MNTAEIETPRRHETPGLLFDWQLDIERLTRQTHAALASRKADEWVLAECECTLDLLAAELVAARHSCAEYDAAADTVEHLKAWHSQLERLVEQLKSLPS
jgi:hypothetical protein